MARVRILTDSTADLPADLARQLEITVVPAYVQMDGQSLRDGEQITRAEFYRRLPTLADLPTTATPSAHEFAQAFRRLAGQADEVIAILLSASLSGLFNAARLGAEEVPDLRIHLVDSRQLAMGLGWQVILAAEAAAAGASAAEIVHLLEGVRPRIRILALLDTLTYLRRSGRLAWPRALAARLLHIKPLLGFYEGEATLVGMARTRRKGLARLMEMIAALGRFERLALVHTQAPDVASFRHMLSTIFPPEQTLTSEVGPIVGTHIGPGALGIAAIIAA